MHHLVCFRSKVKPLKRDRSAALYHECACETAKRHHQLCPYVHRVDIHSDGRPVTAYCFIVLTAWKQFQFTNRFQTVCNKDKQTFRQLVLTLHCDYFVLIYRKPFSISPSLRICVRGQYRTRNPFNTKLVGHHSGQITGVT